jgi:hypothetical protein
MSNIEPLHHHRPKPTPPSCFSQLAGLAQCWDDVKAMQQVLSKIIADLLADDPTGTIIPAIIAAIQQSGTNVPIIGVTDGSWAQPGQVGELLTGGGSDNFNPGGISYVAPLTLTPGDWNLQGLMAVSSGTGPSDLAGAYFGTSVVSNPPIVSMPLQCVGGAITNNPSEWSLGMWFPSNVAPITVSTPFLVTFAITYAGTEAGSFDFYAAARRVR